MTIEVKCPRCGAGPILVPEQFLGRKASCRKCGASFVVTAPGEPQATLPTREQAPPEPTSSLPAPPNQDAKPSSPLPDPESRNRIPSSFPWEAGQVLLDTYRVIGLLGQGAMGLVHRVRHLGWDLDLALKSPRPEVLARAGGVESFETEAETWVKLGLHPHVVSCHYVRRLDGIPRVFAEYISGGSLSQWIEDGRLYRDDPALALARILDLAIQFAWGLDYAHAQGLIHQDVKPANAMITPEGTLKVADFGLARGRPVAGADHTGTTGTIMVNRVGLTPAYASPEQTAGDPLTRRSDIWSWGLVVLTMFAGEVFWPVGTLAAEALSEYLSTPPLPTRPAMPQDLAELLGICFQMNQERRPRHLSEVVDRLIGIFRQATGSSYPRPPISAAGFTPDSLNNRAASLLDLGRPQEAEKLWTQALALAPAHPEATANLALTGWRAGGISRDQALQSLTEAARSRGDDWRLPYALGRLHLERADYVAALEVLEGISEPTATSEEVRQAREEARDRLAESRGPMHVLAGHENDVAALAFTPDGRLLLSAGWDKVLRLWDMPGGQPRPPLIGHTDVIWGLAVSADSRLVLSGSSDATLKLWDLDRSICLKTMTGHGAEIGAVALSPDGRRALSGCACTWENRPRDLTVRLWDTDSGRCLQTFTGHAKNIKAVALSPNGRLGASGSLDRQVILWDLATARPARILTGHQRGLLCLGFSPDGALLFSGDSGGWIKVWEAATGRLVREFRGQTLLGPKIMAFNPTRTHALCGDQRRLTKTVELWTLATGADLYTFTGPTENVTAVAFSEDGRWGASGGRDRLVRVWRINLNQPTLAAPILISKVKSSEVVLAVRSAFDSDLEKAHAALTAGDRVAARLLLENLRDNPEFGRSPTALAAWVALGRHYPRAALRGAWEMDNLGDHQRPPTSLAISRDGRLLLAGYWANSPEESGIAAWNLDTGQPGPKLMGHQRTVLSLSLDRTGRLALSTSEDGSLRLWDAASGQTIREFPLPGQTPVGATLTGDGRFALATVKDLIMVWDLAGSSADPATLPAWTLGGLGGPILDLTLTPDENLALAGHEDGTARLWDPTSGRMVQVLAGHQGPVNSVAVSRDGRLALTGSQDGDLRLWDLATGKMVRVMSAFKAFLQRGVDISPDGHLAVAAAGNQIILWNLSTGQPERKFESHSGRIAQVLFHPDGHLVLSAATDKTIRRWYLDWDLAGESEANLAERAAPYLAVFVEAQRPRTEPHPKQPAQAWKRHGTPVWTADEFAALRWNLGQAGLGHLDTAMLLAGLAGQPKPGPRFRALPSPEDGILPPSCRERGPGFADDLHHYWPVHHLAWNLDLTCVMPRPDLNQPEMEEFISRAGRWVGLDPHPLMTTCLLAARHQNRPFLLVDDPGYPDLREWLDAADRDQGPRLRTAEHLAQATAHLHGLGLTLKNHQTARIAMPPNGPPRPYGLDLISHGEDGVDPSLGRLILELLLGPESIDLAGNKLAAHLEAAFPIDPESRKFVDPLSTIARVVEPNQRPQSWETALALSDLARAMGHARQREPAVVPPTAALLNNKAVSLLYIKASDQASDQAINLLTRARNIDPDHPEATFNHALFSWRLGSITDREVDRRLDCLGRRHPGRSTLARGLVYLEAGDFQAAATFLSAGADDKYAEPVALEAAQKKSDQTRRRLRSMTGFDREVTATALSADGRVALAASLDGRARVWETTSGHPGTTFSDRGHGITAAALSANGRLAVIGDLGGALTAYEVETGRVLLTMAAHFGQIGALCLSQDGRRVLSASASDRAIFPRDMKLTDLTDSRMITGFAGHQAPIWSVDLNREETLVLSGSADGTAQLWDARTGQSLTTWRDTAPVRAVAFAPDGRTALTAGEDRLITLRAVPGGETIRTLAGHLRSVLAAVFSPCGRFVVSGGEDRTLRVWEVDSGRCISTLEAQAYSVRGLALSRDGRLALAALNDPHEAALWHLGLEPPRRADFWLADLDANQFDPANVVRYQHRLWRANKEHDRGNHATAAENIIRLRQLPGRREDPEARSLWTKLARLLPRTGLRGAREMHSLKGHVGGTEVLASSPDGRFISGGADGRITIWDPEMGRAVQTLNGHGNVITALAVSPDGSRAVSGGFDLTLQLWHLADGHNLGVHHLHDDLPAAVVLTPEGMAVSAGSSLLLPSDKNLLYWNPINGQIAHNFQGFAESITALGLAPRGNLLGAGLMDGRITIFEVATGRNLLTVTPHREEVTGVVLDPDAGWAISSSTDGTLARWSLTDGQVWFSWPAHSGGVTRIVPTPDGRFLVSAGKNGRVGFWEPETGRCLFTLASHHDWVKALALGSDGLTLASGGRDGSLLFQALDWDLDTDRPAPPRPQPRIQEDLPPSKPPPGNLDSFAWNEDKVRELFNPGRLTPKQSEDDWIPGYEQRWPLGEFGPWRRYLAFNQAGGRRVNIELRTAPCSERDLGDFLRAARLLISLNHPNILNILEYGGRRDRLYLIVDHCPGGDLTEHLVRAGGRLTPTEGLDMFLQILEGLDYLHTKANLVHGSLGPGSIRLMDPDPNPQVRLALPIRGPDLVEPDPRFMPRPQIINRNHRPEYDLWAAAALYYYVVTGVAPRDPPPAVEPDPADPSGPNEQLASVLPILTREPSFPAAVAEVLDQALNDDPDFFYKTAVALREAIEESLTRIA